MGKTSNFIQSITKYCVAKLGQMPSYRFKITVPVNWLIFLMLIGSISLHLHLMFLVSVLRSEICVLQSLLLNEKTEAELLRAKVVNLELIIRDKNLISSSDLPDIVTSVPDISTFNSFFQNLGLFLMVAGVCLGLYSFLFAYLDRLEFCTDVAPGFISTLNGQSSTVLDIHGNSLKILLNPDNSLCYFLRPSGEFVYSPITDFELLHRLVESTGQL